MNIGKIVRVGILLLATLFTPIIYAKYARVNVIMLTFSGNFDRGPPLVNVKLLQIILGFRVAFAESSGKETPIEIVIKQFTNNIPRNIMPFISELKRADNAKKLININGANLNPIYTIDCTFNKFIIGIYKNDIFSDETWTMPTFIIYTSEDLHLWTFKLPIYLSYATKGVKPHLWYLFQIITEIWFN